MNRIEGTEGPVVLQRGRWIAGGLWLASLSAVAAGADWADESRHEATLRRVSPVVTASAREESPLPVRPLPQRVGGKAEASRRESTGQGLTGLVLGVTSLGLLGAGLAWWLKKQGGGTAPWLPREAMEVLGQRPLSARVSLQLVRCGKRVLVLSVTPDGATALSEVTDPIEIDLLVGACQRRGERDELSSFERTLRRKTAGAVGAAGPEVRHG